VRQPIDAIADLLEQHDAFFHVDAAQGYGKDIDPLRHPRIDLISVSGHKVHARRASRVIVRRRGRQRPPSRRWYLEAARNWDSGPAPACSPDRGVGQGSRACAGRIGGEAEFLLRISRSAAGGIAALDPVINGDPALSTPHILNFSIRAWTLRPRWKPGGMSRRIQRAACSSQFYTCSHVLSAMGLPESEGRCVAAFLGAISRQSPISRAWSGYSNLCCYHMSREEVIAYKRARFATRLPWRAAIPFALLAARRRAGVWQGRFAKFAARMLGEMVEYEFSVAAGAPVEVGQSIGWVEGFKAVSDLYSVAAGEFLGSNPALGKTSRWSMWILTRGAGCIGSEACPTRLPSMSTATWPL